MRHLLHPFRVKLSLLTLVVTLTSTSSLSGSYLTQAGSVGFSLSPASLNLAMGDTVAVAIQFDASVDPVTAAQAYLNFDPNLFQVVDALGNPVTTVNDGTVVTGGTWTDGSIQNRVDNTTGEIDYVAGRGTTTGIDASGGVFELATFILKASPGATGSSSVGFWSVSPRQTKAVSGFNDVTGTVTGLSLSINSTPTDIALGPASVDENQPSGTVVGSLTTTDPDTADTHTYSLVAGSGDTDNNSFSIPTGSNQLQTSAVFDFETKNSFSIRVQTDDGNGGTFQKSVGIALDNLIDTVSLTMSLQGRGDTGPSWTMPFEIKLYEPGTSNLVDSYSSVTAASSNGNSSFDLTDIRPGSYDIWAKGETTLAKLLPNVGLNVEPAANVDLGEQEGGDFNGDNIVDSLDFSAFLGVGFGIATSLHDHNRDGVVDITDYGVLVFNFGKFGPAAL